MVISENCETMSDWVIIANTTIDAAIRSVAAGPNKGYNDVVSDNGKGAKKQNYNGWK